MVNAWIAFYLSVLYMLLMNIPNLLLKPPNFLHQLLDKVQFAAMFFY